MAGSENSGSAMSSGSAETKSPPKQVDIGLVVIWIGLVVTVLAVALGIWNTVYLVDLDTKSGGRSVPTVEYFNVFASGSGLMMMLGIMASIGGLLIRRLDFTDWSKTAD